MVGTPNFAKWPRSSRVAFMRESYSLFETSGASYASRIPRPRTPLAEASVSEPLTLPGCKAHRISVLAVLPFADSERWSFEAHLSERAREEIPGLAGSNAGEYAGAVRAEHELPGAPMTSMTRVMAMVVSVTVGGGVAVAAPPAPPPAAEKIGGVQGDVLGVLTDVEKKILSLEEAVPQNKFDWRPAPGVRSVAEAYLHVAFANYNLIRIAVGKTPPADAGFTQDRGKWDTQTTDKAKIKTILEKSFAFAHEAIRGLSEADLDRKIDLFGHPMTVRAVLLILVGHDNEHLGQSVAYARANKIVPPWSEGKK